MTDQKKFRPARQVAMPEREKIKEQLWSIMTIVTINYALLIQFIISNLLDITSPLLKITHFVSGHQNLYPFTPELKAQ